MNMINPNKFPARTERPIQRGSPINKFGCWETIGKRRRKLGNSHDMVRSCEIRDLVFFPFPSHFLGNKKKKTHKKEEESVPAQPERARPIAPKAEYLFAPWPRACLVRNLSTFSAKFSSILYPPIPTISLCVFVFELSAKFKSYEEDGDEEEEEEIERSWKWNNNFLFNSILMVTSGTERRPLQINYNN
jgi:hypothetical protein